MADDVLAIRGLEKRFPRFRLGPLDVKVPKGVIYGLIGPNGAGKTTTIDLVMGMGREDGGTVHVFGLDHIRNEVAVKSRVGYVNPNLFYNTWGDVKQLIGFVRNFYERWDDDYCADLLSRFDIGWHAKVANLSLGSRMKLGLVVALSHRPELLLLDEPQTGLDALAKRELFTELRAAVKDGRCTVLISSNSLGDVERLADHVGLIQNGRMLLEGSRADLLERFRVVDVAASAEAALRAIPGVVARERIDGRCRLLVDLSTDALERLRALGVSDADTARVTLEDLFVLLVKEG